LRRRGLWENGEAADLLGRDELPGRPRAFASGNTGPMAWNTAEKYVVLMASHFSRG
jgi:hypothetical protein